ncbi:transposase [Liquorilactobacillus sicerae]|uniref:transposase n=1 Tax=Liquorilactobacillus sicerae TaxID=1416943 RepID=UPI003D02C64F
MIACLKTFTNLKKNLKYVSNSCESAFSNGPIEGINRKIKALKRICYGFKNMVHFYARILLIVK